MVYSIKFSEEVEAVEPFIGQIQLFPYDFVHRDWALCDGKPLNISENQALFSLIGTKFGGDGITNFALPDSTGINPLRGDWRYYIALQGIYPSRS